ncbi:MAG: MotA/TolQ/ExbB proton channel family protein [Planctomycetes bacterium]|nr:MotA/TolQ/ExbB proton channel family protein [Planctomycetota bacterium]
MSIATLTVTLLALGQVGSEGATGAGAPPGAQIQSVWDFVVKGGPMMIPIAICSLVALTVVIERLFSLRRRVVIPTGFLPGLQAALGSGSGDRESALAFCRADGSPTARVFATGIRRLGEPIELLEKHVQEAGEREVLKLRKFLRLLSVIAAISPLMGLLGTIFGMIKAFQTVAMSGEALGKAEMLAKGIYEAMITTAAGLLVAIPTLIAYHWISARIESLVVEIDQMSCEFIEEYAENGVEASNAATPLRPLRRGNDSAERAGKAEAAMASA